MIFLVEIRLSRSGQSLNCKQCLLINSPSELMMQAVEVYVCALESVRFRIPLLQGFRRIC